MNQKNKTTAMLKNLLTTGSMDIGTGEHIQSDDNAIADEPQDTVDQPVQLDESPVIQEETVPVVDRTSIDSLREDVDSVKNGIEQLRCEIQSCTTTKEQHKAYMEAVSKRDSEIANRKLMTMLEQMCTMREDFFKLCSDMERKIDKFSPKDILDSFTAYGTDMENILTDAGVHIGRFDYDRLNTIHQRIVDVVPTDDMSQDRMIAERLSEGYKFENRVLLKEKVKIYKFTEKPDEGDGTDTIEGNDLNDSRTEEMNENE